MWSRLAFRPIARQIQARPHSAIAGPASVKVSTAEVVVHGIVMFTGWLAIPVWVLTHMKDYKGKE